VYIPYPVLIAIEFPFLLMMMPLPCVLSLPTVVILDHIISDLI
jgi:hypothetical protein